MSDIFQLRYTGRGRSVSDFATALDYADLVSDARTVLRNLSLVEKEVLLKDKRMTFLMRIRPYRARREIFNSQITVKKYRRDLGTVE